TAEGAPAPVDYRSPVIARAPFGRTGHQSRRTLFGAAALSRATGAEADRALELVLRYDLDHLDTAASYGDSELRIAPWLASEGRDRFFIAHEDGEAHLRRGARRDPAVGTAAGRRSRRPHPAPQPRRCGRVGGRVRR